MTARLALARLPGMLTDLVREAFAADVGVRVHPLPLADGEALESAVTRDAPDVLILGTDRPPDPADPDGPDPATSQVLYAHPRLVVLGLALDGRSAWLCELRPVVRPIGEASADSLQDAVHAALARRLA